MQYLNTKLFHELGLEHMSVTKTDNINLIDCVITHEGYTVQLTLEAHMVYGQGLTCALNAHLNLADFVAHQMSLKEQQQLANETAAIRAAITYTSTVQQQRNQQVRGISVYV